MALNRKPPVWVLTQDEVDEFVRDFFNDKHSTLWGRSFDIVNQTTRDQAEEFLQELLMELGFVEILNDPLIGAEGIE